MWLYLGDPYDPSWNGRPPQLLQEDWPTWEKYRQKIEKEMEVMYYNVAMTTHKVPPEANTEELQKMYMYPVSKRIDAVGWDGKQWHLYEVNRNAKLRSLGQAVAYRELWNAIAQKYGFDRTDMIYIITEVIDPDVKFVCEQQKILYIKV